MGWYVNLNGQTLGPVDEPKVVEWIQSGQLLRGSICVVGSQEWTDLAAHPAFAAALRRAAPPPPPPLPSASSSRVAETPSGPRMAVASSARAPTPSPMAPAMRTGASQTSRWLRFCLVMFLLWAVGRSNAFALVVGVGFVGWGVFGYKRSRRTAVELVVGRPKPARWAAALTTGLGVVFALGGYDKIQAQHEVAARTEQQVAQEAAHRKELQAGLLAEAPAKAAAWKASLTAISSGMPNVKTNDDLRRKLGELTALRDQAKTWLAQLDVKPPDAVTAESEIESKSRQIQATADFVDGAAAFDKAFQDARALIAKRSWIEADEALDEVLQRVPALQTADPSFRTFVAGGFDPDRKKAQVAAAKAGIAGAVAAAKRQQAAEEAAEKKREEAAQAYRALCGESPGLSAWDGELIGLASAIKETANDPDSIDVSRCTQPALTKDNCWVSTCNVRGKNGFGGLILLRQTWSYSKLLGFRQVK